MEVSSCKWFSAFYFLHRNLKMTWDQSFPVCEYPIQHGLAQCWLVIMVFVSEIFSFKNVCAHVSMGKCAHPYPSRPTCCLPAPSYSVPSAQERCVRLHAPHTSLSAPSRKRAQPPCRDRACSLRYIRIFCGLSSATYCTRWTALILDDQQKMYKWHFWT